MSYTFDGECGFDLAQKKYQTTGRKIACEANSESWRVFVCVCYDLNRRRCKIMCIACTQIFKWINASQQKQNKQTKIEWHMSINLWFWDYDRCFFRTLWIYDSSAFGIHTSRLYCVLIGAQTMWWNYAENARNHRLDGFDRLMCTNL